MIDAARSAVEPARKKVSEALAWWAAREFCTAVEDDPRSAPCDGCKNEARKVLAYAYAFNPEADRNDVMCPACELSAMPGSCVFHQGMDAGALRGIDLFTHGPKPTRRQKLVRWTKRVAERAWEHPWRTLAMTFSIGGVEIAIEVAFRLLHG